MLQVSGCIFAIGSSIPHISSGTFDIGASQFHVVPVVIEVSVPELNIVSISGKVVLVVPSAFQLVGGLLLGNSVPLEVAVSSVLPVGAAVVSDADLSLSVGCSCVGSLSPGDVASIFLVVGLV